MRRGAGRGDVSLAWSRGAWLGSGGDRGRDRLSDIFISYARETASQAGRIAQALRALGYGVWLDDQLPAHRAYAEVIEERLKAAKAVVVVWSAEALKSDWVRAEADVGREAGTLVQLTLDGALPPLPFNQIQCADLSDWSGDIEAPGWRKVLGSVADLAGNGRPPAPAAAAAPLALPSKPSIAVLPFANLSNDPDQEYFADGMVEEIVGALSRYKQIFVIGSGSSLALKGEGLSPQEAAQLLGVRYLLDGSVRKGGGRVRISVNLTEASDGEQIWAERFDDTLQDVFALQDKVALSVAGIIEPTVRDAEVRRLSNRPTDNMGAYDLYLRGSALRDIVQKDNVLQALGLFERAIALDPNFAAALVSASICHLHVLRFHWADDLAMHARRRTELVERALSLGGDDAYVLAMAASQLLGDGSGDARAVALVDRAIALNPGHSRVWFASGLIRIRIGRPEIALEHLETALRLNPLFTQARTQMAVAMFEQGRFAEALAAFKENPNPSGPLSAVLAAVHGHLGQASEGQAALAAYRAVSAAPVEAVDIFHRPEHRKLFLDGIALLGAAPGG